MKTSQEKSKRKATHGKSALFLSVFAAVLILDFMTKYAADSLIKSKISLIPGFFSFNLVHNFGAGFGIFQHQRIVLSLISIGVLIAIAYYYREFNAKPEIIAAALVAAGTLGNLWQRIYYGYVTDFLDISFWPSFNVADSALCIGVGLFIWVMLREKK